MCASPQGKSAPVPIIGDQRRWLRQAGSAAELRVPSCSLCILLRGEQWGNIHIHLPASSCPIVSESETLFLADRLGLRAFSLLLLSSHPAGPQKNSGFAHVRVKENRSYFILSKAGTDPLRWECCKWAKSMVNPSCSPRVNDALIIFKVKNSFCV